MPVTLPNLYCSPQDIYDQLGIEAAQLRLDDQNQASGQQVATTADAIIGASTISVSALQYPLLRGTNLVFSDASMDTPITAVLNAASVAGATSLTVVPLTTQVNSGAIAIDNGVNVWLAGLLVKATKYATARVKLYCCNRYNDSDLVNSWSVNAWATTIAARWVGTRLFRAAPVQIESAYEEAMEELKAVKNSELNIEDIGTRTSGWPAFSNVTVDHTYTDRVVRVEPNISEPTTTQYPQSIDWQSAFLFEF
jgi:hypothetical protein